MVTSLTFNAFQENTYIISTSGKEAVIIDPGCHSSEEKMRLDKHIVDQGLQVKALLNTHCHIDHVFGNKFVVEKYRVKLYTHKGELPVLAAVPQVATMYGLPTEVSPPPDEFLAQGDKFKLGSTELLVLFMPGHSPASIGFYCEEENYVIAGDVLFDGSIGRTDLPGGNFDTLIQSIRSELLTLPDHTIVYPGHGESTTVGKERASNPFLRGI
ncbi:MAG: MBL fold metallo-hydrolase [Saprospiraceae bacterium]|nr:MBL fold metallo-hydrolase [Saprospiraceae bacterium]